MAPKRQRKAVVKRTKKVVEETVQVAVVDEEGNTETVVVESPSTTRVVEVSVEEKQSDIESVTVGKTHVREEEVEKEKGKEKGKAGEEPVGMDVEERENEVPSREEDKTEKRKSNTMEAEQSKEGERDREMRNYESEEGMKESEEPAHVSNMSVSDKEAEKTVIVEDDRIRNNEEIRNEVTEMETQTPEERDGEDEAKGKRKTVDEVEMEDMAAEEKTVPKTPRKVEAQSKEKRTPEKGKRKRKKRNSIPSRGDVGMGDVGGYKTYLYRVLKQVHPTLAMSSRAMDVLEMMMADMFERLADEASKLSKYTGKLTISSREVHDAVRLVLPGELCKHAISEGTKAVSKYMEDKL